MAMLTATAQSPLKPTEAFPLLLGMDFGSHVVLSQDLNHSSLQIPSSVVTQQVLNLNLHIWF